MYEENSVEFMGVLVDRQYTSSQKYAQLVFETAEGMRLSLTRNINMVRSLRLGLTYTVTGPERTVGHKRFIHEPTATLVTANKFSFIFRSRKIVTSLGVGLIVVLSGVGVLAYAAHNANDSASQPVTHKETPAAKSTSINPVTAPISTQPATDNTQTAPVQQQTKDAPATTTRPTRQSTPTQPITNTTTPPAVNNTVTTPTVTDPANIPSTPDSTTVTTPPPADTPTDTQTPPDSTTDPTTPPVNP